MEMTKVVKPFSRRVWPNTFGNRVCVLFLEYIFFIFKDNGSHKLIKIAYLN